MTKSKYEERIVKLESEVFAKPRPWYKSFGVWLAIVLTLVVLYLVYIFYMNELGYQLEVLPWLKPLIDQIFGSIKL